MSENVESGVGNAGSVRGPLNFHYSGSSLR